MTSQSSPHGIDRMNEEEMHYRKVDQERRNRGENLGDLAARRREQKDDDERSMLQYGHRTCDDEGKPIEPNN